MPRQFAFRGDRLAFSWGIVAPGRVAAGILVVVRRRHARPDPALLGRRVRLLHALARPAWSATGCTTRASGWRWRLAINALGAVLTAGRPGRRRDA